MKKTKETFSLCCGGRKCPLIEVEENTWHIKDDFGGAIKLTKEQVEEFLTKAPSVIRGDK